MDEKEYRLAYQSLTPVRCVFEKAINSRVCNCSQSRRFNLADREGVACQAQGAQKRCQAILRALRENSRFVLRQKSVAGQLPHYAEIKIQNGGVQGIANLFRCPADGRQHAGEQDIFGLFESAEKKYQTIERFPYSEIIKQICAYQVRRRRKK